VFLYKPPDPPPPPDLQRHVLSLFTTNSAKLPSASYPGPSLLLPGYLASPLSPSSAFPFFTRPRFSPRNRLCPFWTHPIYGVPRPMRRDSKHYRNCFRETTSTAEKPQPPVARLPENDSFFFTASSFEKNPSSFQLLKLETFPLVNPSCPRPDALVPYRQMQCLPPKGSRFYDGYALLTSQVLFMRECEFSDVFRQYPTFLLKTQLLYCLFPLSTFVAAFRFVLTTYFPCSEEFPFFSVETSCAPR